MSARITGSFRDRWRRAEGVTRISSPEPEDAHRTLDALELARAHVFGRGLRAQAAARLLGQDDLAAFCQDRESRRDIGRHAGGSIGPARARAPLDLGRAEERGARVDTDVHAQRVEAILEL